MMREGRIQKTVKQRIVLAYSGDFETAASIPSLADAHQAEIITLTLDLGSGRDLEEIRDRALAAGAARAHVIDAREEFVRDFVLPSLQAGPASAEADPTGAALVRALVGRKLAEAAAIEQAHGIIDRFRTDESLWGRQGESHVLTRAVPDAPDTPAYVEIAFERGIPVAVNGISMAATELIESIAIIAGHHGVGRMESTGACVEAPAAVVLRAAYAALAAAVPADVTGSVRLKLCKGALETSDATALDYATAVNGAVPRP